LIGPFGKNVYIVNGANKWHQYKLDNGRFKLAGKSFKTDESKPV
jgi:hypothetical protein